MKHFLPFLLLTLLFSVSLLKANAQDLSAEDNKEKSAIDSCEADHNRWYVGGLLGVYQFYGDISENNFFTGGTEYGYFNGMWGVKVGHNFNSRFGIEAQYSMGKMSSYKKDIWFDAQVRNLGANFTMNLTNIVKPLKFNKKWNVNILIGAGFMGFRSQLYDGANNDSILNNVGYDKNGDKDALKYQSYFNIGTTVAYKINEHFDVFFEVSFMSTPTDELDSKPVTLSELDSYSYTALGIHYTFGKHDLAYKWNPKPCYYKYVEDELADLEEGYVGMGNKIDALETCCNEKNFIDPCDTSTVDTDGDAVPDCRDLEENSPKGSIVNFQGIALVVNDSNNAGGQPSPYGAMRRGGGAPAIFFQPIYYDYDKSFITTDANKTIVNVALYMKRFPDSRILISGNCDSRASDNYNFNLSERRCNAAVKKLVNDYGIDRNRFEVQPNGKKLLLFKQHDINRRVDFSVIN